jgi:hypothetical protein
LSSSTSSNSTSRTSTTTTTSSTQNCHHHPPTTLSHLILDYDSTIPSILQRFGYNAIVMYEHPSQQGKDTNNISGLGRMLKY